MLNHERKPLSIHATSASSGCVPTVSCGSMATMIRWSMTALVILLLIISPRHTAWAVSISDSSSPVALAAMKLVGFGSDPKAVVDVQAVEILVNYVLLPKAQRDASLAKMQKATGAYHEFDTRIPFGRFLQYTYSSRIPSVLTNPASLRYSLWTDLPGSSTILPGLWLLAATGSKPVVIRGLERDGITPDLTTGVYYEYDLKRTLILLNHKGRQVLISISNQMDKSDVGKKGFILGSDSDWSYYYSGETGSATTGLGWIKSYIYDYFSVGVHIESGETKDIVRSGVFQWIRAGWSGINFVESHHVIKGMKRHSVNFKSILESPKLPSPEELAGMHQALAAFSRKELVEKYSDLQHARLSLAVLRGQIKAPKDKTPDAYADTPEEQIIEELMLEHFKAIFGKPSLPGR